MVNPDRIIDTHAHVLPGVDDGAKTLADSIRVVRWLVSQGITDIIATPHYVDETEYMSSVEKNQKLLEDLRKRLEADDIKVKNYYLGGK